MAKKCNNCKFGQNSGCERPYYEKQNKYIPKIWKYTTNSKHPTHCDKHEPK